MRADEMARARRREERACPVCGQRKPMLAWQKYCSANCLARAGYRRRAGRPIADRAKATE